MIRRLPMIAAALAVTLLAAPNVMASGKDGEKLFKMKCGSCHSFEKHGNGPNLKGVIGRKAGVTDFGGYKTLKDSAIIWDEAQIDAWITDPKAFIGKVTPMTGKVPKEDDRAAIIEYLKANN